MCHRDAASRIVANVGPYRAVTVLDTNVIIIMINLFGTYLGNNVTPWSVKNDIIFSYVSRRVGRGRVTYVFTEVS